VGFVLEQALGHITHADNLVRHVGGDPRVDPAWALIPFDMDPRWARVPGYGNWTVRAGVRARRAVTRIRREGPLDGLFVHTQVPAMLMPDRLRRTPSVVSLDATPLQYDELGEHYGHAPGGAAVEGAKHRLHRLALSEARRLVAWSEWTKQGLVDDYGIDAEKVVVIAPGVDYGRWAAEARSDSDDAGGDGHAVRVLFVGGDLARKGGDTLVDAVRGLRAGGADVELDLVTHASIPSEDGITVHNGLGPNTPALIELYRRADVFCLPTLGDCLPMVLSEAGAMGLPLVSTDVGAIREIVRPGETGLLVPPRDEAQLGAAIGRLVDDPELRRRLGGNGRALVREQFDAAVNARRLVDVVLEAVGARR
jgi:glycosyltransferase involved in cell wall biosynthesis